MAALNPVRILIVDDERIPRVTLARMLENEGYFVVAVDNGVKALSELDQQEYDLMIVDLRMPGMDGLELLRLANLRSPNTRGIILTAHGSMDTAITAIRNRAYDYLLKPFQREEIVASVRRVLDMPLRSANTIAENSIEGYAVSPVKISRANLTLPGGVVLDWSRRQLAFKGQAINLTPTEMRVFEILIEHLNEVVPYSELVLLTQGYEVNPDEAAQILRPVFSRLRQKLANLPGGEHWIQTIRGAGYALRFK